MKIRTDFVTNSSSSSFVAVFGRSTDKDLAQKSVIENDMKECLYTGAELLKEWDSLQRWHTCNDWCWVDPFPDKDSIKESEYITYVCKEFNLNPAEIVGGWKERFGTYKAFKSYLRS